MINWIKRFIGKKLNVRTYYLDCATLGVSDLESAVLQEMAKHYPFSAREVLAIYVHGERSFDFTEAVLKDARAYSLDIWDSFRLNTSAITISNKHTEI